MKSQWKSIVLALVLAGALCSPVVALNTLTCVGLGCYSPAYLAQFQTLPGAEVPPLGAVGVPDEGKVGTPNIIIHQAPSAPTVIDTGSIAGQALTWVITVFGGTIGAALTAWIVKLLKRAGMQVSDEASEKLNRIIVNGLHSAAPAAQAALAGKGQVAVRNETLAGMVRYVQAHGADTLKTLGVDPSDPKLQEVLRARAERLVADPAAVTPKVLDAAPPGEAAATSQGPSGTGQRG